MSFRTALLLLFPFAVACGSPGDASPTGRDDRTNVPRFDGSRAFGLITRQVAFGPRNPGSAGHRACRDYLESELRRYAHGVELQHFSHAGYAGERLRMTNIIAVFNPSARTRVLLAAHWDSRPRAERDPDPARRSLPIPGANDGASGVAVLLELARLMKSQPPPVGVDIVLFDGEDYGEEGDSEGYLLGAREYARSLAGTRLPDFGILLDMVGDAHLEIRREENSVLHAPEVVDLIWATAARLGIPEFAEGPGPAVLDDHIPLIEAGVPTANVIDFEYPDASHRFWHTHADTPEHCSPESLEAVGRVLTHLVYTRTP